MYKTGLYVAIGIALTISAQAADWPQFCGPDRNNISAETGLADSWPSDGPDVLWETAVFDGYSGPAIKGGKVYLIDREDEDSLLRCLDLKTGKELWAVAFSDPGTMGGKKYAGTRGTPTVLDDAIYLVTGYGSFVCIDPKLHKVKWKHHLIEDYEAELPFFGHAQAPVIYKDIVLVALYTQDIGVVAYDRKTGEQLWTSPVLGKYSYITPSIETICGIEMIVAGGSREATPKERGRKRNESEPKKELAKGHMVGLSLKDGSILWDYTGWQCRMAIPHPVVLPDNRVFITGGYKAGSAMIQIEKNGSQLDVKELYKTDDVGSQLHQPILVGDHFFIGSNSNSRKDGLACFGLDGKLKWRTRDIKDAPNFERGPYILADGKLILLDGKTGKLHLVKADVSGYKELASAQMVKEKDMAWAPLALSDGKLLVRDWNTLKCVDLK